MVKEKVVRINPDGFVESLYFDDLPVEELGKARCPRASDIVWDDVEQGWVVTFRPPLNHVKIGGVFKSRADALRVEEDVLNAILSMEDAQ